MMVTLSQYLVRTVLVIILAVQNGAAGTTEGSTCGCSITVMGPLPQNTLIFMCNAYTSGEISYEHLEYTWRLVNASGDDSRENTTQVIQTRQPKLFQKKPLFGNYTCLVSGPGITRSRSCSISLLPSATGGENSTKFAAIIPSCEDRRAPVFQPASVNGMAALDVRGNLLLTCIAPKFLGSNAQTELAMELLPLESYDFAHDSEISNSVTTDSFSTITESDLSSGRTQANNSTKLPNANKEMCDFHYKERSSNTITIEFVRPSKSCRTIYVCSAGLAPRSRLRSSTLLMFWKSAHTPTSTHPRHRNIKGKSKRYIADLLDDDKGNTSYNSHHADDEDEDDDRTHEVKNKIDVLGLTIGVVFMVLLTAVAVTCAVIWRKRMVRHHSRYMARVSSSTKAPLFINKAHAKEENNELEEFPRKHIRFLDHIGKGTFGTVVMAETYNLQKQKKRGSSNRWKVVAVKMTLISEKSNEQLKKDFLSEVALMKSLPAHSNIITLHASCTAHDPYLMILEYAKHGDLRKYLIEHRTERNYANAAYLAYGVDSRRTGNYYSTTCSAHPGNKEKKYESIPNDDKKHISVPGTESGLITSRDVLSFALQICKGLSHLSQNKIVHRDVAARNVLVCEHKVVKISDFGLARKVGEQDVYERSTKGLLPIRWMSPEALLYNQYSEKSDVWSFGVLLWELITLGSTPYPGLDSTTILEKIRHRELLICPPHSSAVVNNVVSSCWKEDPHIRPSFSQLVQDIEKLLESEVEYLDLDQINDHEYSTLD